MTRGGFWSMAALLLAGVLGGGWLVLSALVPTPARAPASLEEASCAEWLAHPREGDFRLVDCTLDAGRSLIATRDAYGRPTRVVAEVVREDDGPLLFAVSDDRRLLARAERVHADADGHQHTRTLERYGSALHVAQSVEGRIVGANTGAEASGAAADEWMLWDLEPRYVAGRDFLIAPMDRYDESNDESTLPLAIGLTLILLFLPMTLLLFWLQRRWQSRSDDLRRAASGSTKPRFF